MSDDLDRLAADLGNAGREAARRANTAVAKTAADAVTPSLEAAIAQIAGEVLT